MPYNADEGFVLSGLGLSSEGCRKALECGLPAVAPFFWHIPVLPVFYMPMSRAFRDAWRDVALQ